MKGFNMGTMMGAAGVVVLALIEGSMVTVGTFSWLGIVAAANYIHLENMDNH